MQEMKKKILICTPLYPPDIGGPATYSKLLFDELPRKGIDVSVLSFGEVRKFPKVIRHFLYFLKILNLGRSVDVFFAQDPVSVGLPVCLASCFLRKKFILKIVGDYAWEQFQSQISNLKSQKFITLEEFQDRKFDWLTELRRKVERGVGKRAYKIIVPSEYLKKIVLMWGVGSEKINVVYNAFDFSRFFQSQTYGSPTQPFLKRAESDFVLFSAGRLVTWKGFQALVEIFPDLVKQIPNLKLYIIGDGPEREALMFQVSIFKFQDKVILTGQLSHDEVLRYLNTGDIFVLNTGYEGLSHQILEAMAVGIPVVTTNIGGNPELIQDNESGILVEYNNKEQLKNAIFKLYKDKNLRKELVKKAKEKVKEFSKERMINETINILKTT